MNFLLPFLGALCLAHYAVCEVNIDLNSDIQRRISNVLEWPATGVSDTLEHAQRVEQFRQFVTEFGRNYASDWELKFRFESFKKNMDAHDHFVENERGTAEYGMTEFMDYGETELSRFTRQCKNQKELTESEGQSFQKLVQAGDEVLYGSNLQTKAVPASFDWRKKGYISRVLDQGYCSSAWAYAATTALETANAVKTGSFVRLAKQQLIDCDRYNEACCGGYPHLAYFYLYQNGGMEEDKTYNGRAFVQRCHFKRQNAKVQLRGVVLFTNTSAAVNEKLMEQYVAERGPVVVMLTPGALTVYKKGILRQSDSKCVQNSNYLASSVTLVGFGEEGGVKYWIGKNSWGKKWGEQGFFRIERGTNMCSLGSYGVAPIVA